MCAEVQWWCRTFTVERGASRVYQWQQSVTRRLEPFIDVFCFGPCYLEKPSFPEDLRSPKPNTNPICVKHCMLSHLFKWMTEACIRNSVVFVTPLYVTYTLNSFAAVPVHLLPIDWLPLWPLPSGTTVPHCLVILHVAWPYLLPEGLVTSSKLLSCLISIITLHVFCLSVACLNNSSLLIGLSCL